jgi:hypothetical protein
MPGGTSAPPADQEVSLHSAAAESFEQALSSDTHGGESTGGEPGDAQGAPPRPDSESQ